MGIKKQRNIYMWGGGRNLTLLGWDVFLISDLSSEKTAASSYLLWQCTNAAEGTAPGE